MPQIHVDKQPVAQIDPHLYEVAEILGDETSGG